MPTHRLFPLRSLAAVTDLFAAGVRGVIWGRRAIKRADACHGYTMDDPEWDLALIRDASRQRSPSRIPGQPACEWCSNTTVSRLFRIALPAVMLAVLVYTTMAADREQRAWSAECNRAKQLAATNGNIESVFFLPFQYSERIQDAVLFQWPAFACAEIFTQVPALPRSGQPAAPTRAGYAAIGLAVGLYWFVIGSWADMRCIRRKRATHSAAVRVILAAGFVLAAALFVLFLAKDLTGAWQEGPQGAYGFTAWLALVLAVLLVEIDYFRRKPAVSTHG